MRLASHFLLCFALFLLGCQTLPPTSPLPPKLLERSAATPLVVGIPGLRVPAGPLQEEAFGHLESILYKEGFPAITLVYDSQTHPLRPGADLSSEYRSVAVTRILPALVYAVRNENKIRDAQGLSPLLELDLVGFSQGSVLALDLLKRMRELRERFNAFFQVSASEYEELVKDPEFRAFNNTAEDYIAIRNIKVQREKDFEEDPDLKLIYEHGERRVVADFKRFYEYLTGPKTRYPKFAKVILKNNQGKDLSKVENLDNWLDYAQFRVLLPVQFRFFSIAGSLFGVPQANSGYFLIKNFPVLTRLFMGIAAINQIRDTRVGSEHQLELLVDLLEESKKLGADERAYESTYFMVGAHGEKGDGLVGQSSAHLSEHLLSKLDLEALGQGGAEALKTETLPKFRVTGIRATHLPKHGFFKSRLGISQIEPKSPVLPFLLAFIRKDNARLEELHGKYSVPLRQFMVELAMPPNEKLDLYKIKVKKHSRGINASKPFVNPSTKVLIVTGAFRSKNEFEGKVQFSIQKDKEKPLMFEVPVLPGKIHFVTMSDGSPPPVMKPEGKDLVQ